MNFLSSFDNFSDSEEGGILFLQIAAIFGMKKKKKNEWEQNKTSRINNLTRNKTTR